MSKCFSPDLIWSTYYLNLVLKAPRPFTSMEWNCTRLQVRFSLHIIRNWPGSDKQNHESWQQCNVGPRRTSRFLVSLQLRATCYCTCREVSGLTWTIRCWTPTKNGFCPLFLFQLIQLPSLPFHQLLSTQIGWEKRSFPETYRQVVWVHCLLAKHIQNHCCISHILEWRFEQSLWYSICLEMQCRGKRIRQLLVACTELAVVSLNGSSLAEIEAKKPHHIFQSCNTSSFVGQRMRRGVPIPELLAKHVEAIWGTETDDGALVHVEITAHFVLQLLWAVVEIAGLQTDGDCYGSQTRLRVAWGWPGRLGGTSADESLTEASPKYSAISAGL